MALLLAAQPSASDEAVLYRIFLMNGPPLVSYGEFVRLGDQVVFSMPLSLRESEPQLQLVSIPAASVDWARTDRYAQSARYAQYVATRAEEDFARISAEVAEALNRVAQESDPASRLAIAERARKTIAEWPARNFGYRAEEVREVTALLDEVIAELRASAGLGKFDLSLTAGVAAPPAEPLLPPPTLQEMVQQALAAARLTPVPAERMSLLQSVESLLAARGGEGRDGKWATTTLSRVRTEIAAEVRVERRYAELTRRTLAEVSTRATRADVRGVERALESLRARDRALGERRPQAVQSLVAAVEGKLEAARRLRLVRDRWTLRRTAFERYKDATWDAVEEVLKTGSSLSDIKALAGPDERRLRTLDERVGRAVRTLAAASAPEELREVHTLLTSAMNFAASAVQLRRRAVAAADLAAAWDASSAAAAALMLLDRGRDDLERIVKGPVP
jgi:hypothetical protein